MAGAPPGPEMGSAPLHAPPKRFHRPFGVALLSILMIIGGAIVVLVGVALLLGGALLGFAIAGPIGAALGAAIGLVILILGGIWLAAAFGLWNMRGWAWWLAMIVLVLGILGSLGAAGRGAIIGGVLLVYLILVRKHFNQ